MSALIEIENLSYRYPLQGEISLPALQGISLRIDEGEYVALLGANGSGKSTLARHLNALLVPSSGRVWVGGLDTLDPANRSLIRERVGMVFQSPEDQIIATLVVEDVAFGLENLGLPSVEIRQRVEAALHEVGMWEQRERPSYLLSAGQMQRVALAGILAMRPRCIVFDEATAMLDPVGREAVLDMIDHLHRSGLTILTITHAMEEAARAGRIVVLNQGRVALDGSPAEIFSQAPTLTALGLDLPPVAKIANELRKHNPDLPLGLLSVPLLVDALPVLPPVEATGLAENQTPGTPALAAPLIEAAGLGHIYLAGTPLAQRALDGASFRAGAGSAAGILGATGSGKSTLLQHLNGLLIPQEGQVRVGSYSLNDPKVDLKAVRRMAGLVFQLPESQFFEQYVGDEIAYGPRMLGSGERVREDVRWAMEMVGLDFQAYKDRITFALSGGERRKVALASVLAIRSPILLLDEPTAGLDPVSRADLVGRLKGLQGEGITLVLSSHHMEETANLAEELTVMSRGTTVLTGPAGEIFSQVDTLRGLGLEPTAAAEIAAALRARGWPIPAGVIQPGPLVKSITRLLPTASR